jgi:hypothetical protein
VQEEGHPHEEEDGTGLTLKDLKLLLTDKGTDFLAKVVRRHTLPSNYPFFYILQVGSVLFLSRISLDFYPRRPLQGLFLILKEIKMIYS